MLFIDFSGSRTCTSSLRPQKEEEPQSPGVPKGEQAGFVLLGLQSSDPLTVKSGGLWPQEDGSGQHMSCRGGAEICVQPRV